MKKKVGRAREGELEFRGQNEREIETVCWNALIHGNSLLISVCPTVSHPEAHTHSLRNAGGSVWKGGD